MSAGDNPAAVEAAYMVRLKQHGTAVANNYYRPTLVDNDRMNYP
jgi:hypothetical protein